MELAWDRPQSHIRPMKNLELSDEEAAALAI
jgi:hypothetical protein